MATSTGYGPRAKILFNGDERKYELWEAKFMGYLHILKLKETVESEEPNAAKNADVYAELIQVLDDRSLSLVMREATDDGKKAISILREHYMLSGKPKVIVLYTELTTLQKGENECVTDYMLRAEASVAALKNAGEEVGDSLLIAMILKGLLPKFKALNTVITQKDKQPTYSEFKVSLRAFEENEKPTSKDVMKLGVNYKIKCYACKQPGHKADQCPHSRKWCHRCKSKTHNTKECRKKNQETSDAVKNVQYQPERDETEHGQGSFIFKVSNEQAESNVESLKASLLLDCGATTHIVNDKNKFTSFDENFNPEVHFIELADGTRQNNIALSRDNANILLHDKQGNQHNVTLKNALYVPSFNQDIFSVQAASENGASISFNPGEAVLRAGDGTQFEIQKNGRLYYLYSVRSSEHSLQTWHEILGHCNNNDTLKLQNVVEGMSVRNKSGISGCEVCCTLGKMTNVRSREPDAKAEVPLALVHADLAGPVTPESDEGFKYALALTDDYSGAIFTYLLKNKSDTLAATEKFLADSSPFGQVKCIRSDNGSEFTSNTFKTLLVKNKIKHETSAPYSPHQNGTEDFLAVCSCATYIRNRCYNNRTKQTPYQVLTHKKPNLSNMAIFGTECYAYTQNKSKLDARCDKGIFLGYDKGSPAYLVLLPENGIIKKVRNVKFTNKFGVNKPDHKVGYDVDFLPMEVREKQTAPNIGQEQENAAPPADGLNHVAPPIGQEQENAAPPQQGLRQVGPCQLQNIPARPGIENQPTQPAELNPNMRYPVRNTRRPPHLDDYIVDQELDERNLINYSLDYCYTAQIYPKSYEEAMRSKDSKMWREAMNEEMKSLDENNTYTLTKLPEGKSLVGTRWVYTVKEKENGGVRYKVHYVAKGYLQVPEIDYFETFSPTAKITSIRLLMQLALDFSLDLHQMDVKTAYLNAPIDCELYVEQPEGFIKYSETGERLVCKLNKSLYGLKQSGRNWNQLLHNFLTSKNFLQLVSDPCVYIRQHDHGEMTILLIWFDDIIIASNSASTL